MALTPSQVVANELERVDPRVPTLFDREGPFYSAVAKRQPEVVSTRDMRVPMEIRPGGKFGHFSSAGGDLGRGSGPSWEKATVSTIELKYAVEWQTRTQWSTDEKRKSVVNVFRQLLAKSMAEFRRNVDSLCMTAGNGKLATIESVSSGGGVDTYVLDNSFGARLLRYNQDVNVYEPDLSALIHATGSETPITYHDIPTRTIKVAAVTGVAAGDVILASGLSGASPVSLLGVPYHVSDASSGTWLGYDRATFPEIRANRVNANSSALALPFARRALNKIGDRLGMDVNYSMKAWMHPCQQQAYEELAQIVSIVNKDAKAMGVDLYFNDNMRMAGAPVKTHFSWDKRRIDFIVQEVWGRAEMHPAGFYNVDGSKIFEIRGASGGVAASQIFYIVASFNLYVNNPAACSYIDGLEIPDGY